MRVCYVLSSGLRGDYPAMTLLSRESVRIVEPELLSVLVVSASAYEEISVHRRSFFDAFDDVVVVFGVSRGERDDSRYLKTRLRLEIGGDLLFLDSDTIVVRPVSDVSLSAESFAACLDLNSRDSASSFRPEHEAVYERVGWPRPIHGYFNSGVFWMRDNPTMHNLSKTWFEEWERARARGIYQDQPALNAALTMHKIAVRNLPAAYNAMIRVQPRSVLGARVFHYFSDQSSVDDGLIFRSLIDSTKRLGCVDKGELLAFCAQRYPWRSADSVRFNWWAGNYRQAVRVAAKRVGCRVSRLFGA